jgi:hypothetical protein
MANGHGETMRRVLVGVWLAACGGPGSPQGATAPAPPATAAGSPAATDPALSASLARDGEPRFEMTRVMIPMRDGVSLETVIFAPSPLPKALPILLVRTPYGISKDDRSVRSEWYAPLRADGYIFVYQNLRGRFGSEGVFVMDRPPREQREPTAVDETTDVFDTIEWLVHNVPHNSTPFSFDRLDSYEWYLALGPLSQVNERYFHGRVPPGTSSSSTPIRTSSGCAAASRRT